MMFNLVASILLVLMARIFARGELPITETDPRRLPLSWPVATVKLTPR